MSRYLTCSLEEMGQNVSNPIVIMESMACSSITNHPGNYFLFKHFEYYYHFLRSGFQRGDKSKEFIGTKDRQTLNVAKAINFRNS